jgi:hypothetical protein
VNHFSVQLLTPGVANNPQSPEAHHTTQATTIIVDVHIDISSLRRKEENGPQILLKRVIFFFQLP